MTTGPFRVRFIVTMAVATLVAPLAATPAVMAFLALIELDVLMILFAPVMLLTIPGIYGYMFAFLPVLVLGTGLAIVADAYPALRAKRIWVGTGAVFGLAIGVYLLALTSLATLTGAVAGAACAISYRLIIGTAFQPAERRAAQAP